LWFDTNTGATYIYYNSAWVELGGGTMSPYQATSTTRPSAPWTGQLVYETDTQLLIMYNGSAWVEINSALTKAPRGAVAYAKKTTTTALTTAPVTVLSAPSFTAVSGRIYKVTAQVYFQSATASTYFNVSLFNGATKFAGGDYSLTTTTQLYYAPTLTGYLTGISGTTTISISCLVGSGTGNCYADSSGYPNVLIVEDIGIA